MSTHFRLLNATLKGWHLAKSVLCESQNGYSSIEESRSIDGEYKICFYTIDDSDDMDGTLTGYVIFNVVLNHSKEIEKFFDAI